MAGLKLNTQAASQNASAPESASTAPRHPASAQAGPSSASAPAASSAASHSRTQPQPQPPRARAQPQTPALSQAQFQQSSAPPERPPHSPITPPLHPLKSTTPIPIPRPPGFASSRPTFTHNNHPAHVPTIPQPAPLPQEPIDFDDNVDVIALKNAILLLQGQRKRAEDDIRQLERIKRDAVAQPVEFASDLMLGRIGQRDQGTGHSKDDSDDDTSGDDEEEEEDGDVKMEDTNGGEGASNGLRPSPMRPSASSGKGKAVSSTGESSGSSRTPAAPAPSWANIPRPQDVVRCPAIHWSKYAVVGESLDKLHNEQLARPTLGTPAVMGANGTYEFKGETNPDHEKKWLGVAAPYDPRRDKLDKKPKSSRRGG